MIVAIFSWIESEATDEISVTLVSDALGNNE